MDNSALSPLRTNNFVSSSTNGRTVNFRLHDEQTVNGLRKSFGLSFSTVRLKGQHIYTYIYAAVSIYIYTVYICMMYVYIYINICLY